MARPKKGTKRKADSDVESAQPATGSPTQQKLPVRAKEEDTLEAKAPAASVQGTLQVFDSDDSDEEQVPIITTTPSAIEKPQPPPEPESEEESDEDEAPEAVSTQNAASSVRKSSQAAQKAAQEQAAAQKRKRQQRDALFKQQAEGRRKVEGDEAPPNQIAEAPAGRRRMGRNPIPDVLPEEFLTDPSSDGEQEEDDFSRSAATGPKRRKVATVERNLTRLDRAPKDERVGSTVYRVAEKRDGRLPPKLKKYAKSNKAVLLRRNRTTAVKPRAGFFK